MKEEGVWRTIRGRRVFIGKGETLGQAMSKSSKFKMSRTKLRETRDELRNKDALKKENWNKLRRHHEASVEKRGAEQDKKNNKRLVKIKRQVI